MSNAKVSLAMYVLCLVFTSGCAAWTDKSKSKDSKWSTMQFWKKPYQKPNKVAAIWTHDILAMSGKPPTRGFGGRLYFYNDKSQTIPVDGELVVHGYEEVRIGLSLQTEKTKADKTFMFTAEQFTEHFGSSDLGASYSIWIPWDAADGVQKEITLIPTFKGKDGTILQGEPAKLVLPGRKLEDPLANAAIQHVSIQQSQTPTNMGPLPQLSGMRTTTISAPGQFNRGSNNLANSASSVVVHDSNNRGQPFTGQLYTAQSYNTQPANAMNGNMTYASSPAARANAMLAAFATQNNPNPAMPNATNAPLPNAYQLTNGAPFPSTMPNAVHVQSQAQQVPNQYQLQYDQPASTGGSAAMQNTVTPSLHNQQMPIQLPSQRGPQGGQPQPNINNQQLPINNLNPGFAGHATLPDGEVEAAFASIPQFRALGQARTLPGQVQPAGFNSPANFNSIPPVVISGLGQAQPQAQPGQPIYQR